MIRTWFGGGGGSGSGGGSGGVLASDNWLDWLLGATAQASGSGYQSQETLAGTALYDRTFTEVGSDVIPADIPQDGHGLEVGDNFVLAGNSLYFREPGIYLATINGTTPGFVGGDWGFRVYTDVNGSHYTITSKVVPAESLNGGDDQFIFVVWPDVTMHNTDEQPWAPGDLISSSSQALVVDAWQSSGSAQDLSIELYVVRMEMGGAMQMEQLADAPNLGQNAWETIYWDPIDNSWETVNLPTIIFNQGLTLANLGLTDINISPPIAERTALVYEGGQWVADWLDPHLYTLVSDFSSSGIAPGVYLCDASDGPMSFELVAPLENSIQIVIKKIDASANAITISTDGATIDGAATRVISTQYESVTLVCDGTNWWVI